MSQIIRAAAVKVGSAGALVAHKFDAFLSDSPELRSMSLREQWDAYMQQFEPKTLQCVAAGLRIRELIAPLEQSINEPQQLQAQCGQRQTQQQQQISLADAAIARVINAPFDAVKSALKLGGFAIGTVKGVAANARDARADSVSLHADESFFALEKSVREYVGLAPDASVKTVDVAKNRMRLAAEGFSHAVLSESREMLARARKGDVSRADVEDAIESRLSKASALLNEAQKSANAANGNKAEMVAKVSEELQRSIRNMIDSVMRALKSMFSSKAARP